MGKMYRDTWMMFVQNIFPDDLIHQIYSDDLVHFLYPVHYIYCLLLFQDNGLLIFVLFSSESKVMATNCNFYAFSR